LHNDLFPNRASDGSSLSRQAAERTVAEQVGKLKHGQKIKVNLNSGDLLKGRMGSVGADTFTFEPAGKGAVREVAFKNVQTVKPDGLNVGQKLLIVVGVAFVVLVVTAGIIGSKV
jgi:hypothetical protein